MTKAAKRSTRTPNPDAGPLQLLPSTVFQEKVEPGTVI
jgi:hypothetical protein